MATTENALDQLKSLAGYFADRRLGGEALIPNELDYADAEALIASSWLAGLIAQAKAEALEEYAQKLSGEYTLNFASGGTMHEQIVRLLKRDAGIIREAVQS